MQKLITLIGLGAVGAPLADLLYRKYTSDFALLSSEEFVNDLQNLYINDRAFSPQIISTPQQLGKKIGIVFICVKNYQIESVARLLKDLIDKDTIIFPLQNGVYSYDFFSKKFPENVVLEGFAQGPNTKVMRNIYTYQKPGMFHVGSSQDKYKNVAYQIYDLMKDAGIKCFYNDNIKYEVWKKLMLNVAGNAVTALTEIDYCMFCHSLEAQEVCRRTMTEYCNVAETEGVFLTKDDIEDVINYYLSFKVSKKTSMLEDVLNKRPTENEYIAGYISSLAKRKRIATPNIDMLYHLVKIKEEVYLKKI